MRDGEAAPCAAAEAGRASDPARASPRQTLPRRVYSIMAATTLATFGALTAAYELLFNNQTFA